MNKIYQTRLGNLSTSVVVNGVPRRVQFRAWDGVNGLFSTEDEALQQALEQSRGYGRPSVEELPFACFLGAGRGV